MKTIKYLLKIFSTFLLMIIFSSCCPGYFWCSGPDEIPEIEDRYFTPSSISRLCPTHTNGDREFKGHGPNVTVRASLSFKNSDTEIWVRLYLLAKETRSDWTTAEDSWERKLWTVDSGYKIVRLESDMSSNASYRDTDHDLDRPSVRGGNLVEKFEVMGDTGGNDVGNCTSDDVYLNVYFNEIHAKVVRTTP